MTDETNNDNNDVKKLKFHKYQKWLIMFGIIGVFLVVAIISVELGTNTASIEMEAVNDTPEIIEQSITDLRSSASVSDSEIWLTQSESQLKSMAEELERLKKQVEENKTQKTQAKEADKATPVDLPPLPPAPVNQPAYIPDLSPGAKGAASSSIPAPGINPNSQSKQSSIIPQFQAPQPTSGQGQVTVGFETISMEPPETKEDSTYLPVSISPARLLTGVTAPTGGNAQKDPQPMLLEITDLSFLPNKFQQNYTGCFVNAAGYGSLSSERVFARLTSLSCVAVDGQSIEVKVDGYITGPDGGIGIKGKLDDKQGPLLAKALAAGVASGIGSAFAASGSTLSTSPLGTTTTINPNKVLQTGGYNGVSTAMEKLADFYMERVNEMYPTINVGAGVKVDVVIKKGLEIKGWDGEVYD